MVQRAKIITIAEKYVEAVEAVEDWSPCFANQTVRVRLTEYLEPNVVVNRQPRVGPTFRLSVWGADDTGMERDVFCGPKERDAQRGSLRAEWEQIPGPLSRSWLKEHGFVNA